MTAKYGFEDSGDEPLQDQPHSSHRILVVEDERDLRQITAEVLIDAGYHVDVAEDAAAAWHTLQLSKYDLLITNQFMPKVSGVELLKKIHAARLALPVIVDTGKDAVKPLFLREIVGPCETNAVHDREYCR